MHAVILAAGMGNRLGKYTKNNTKCMLDINGRTLIERALDALESNGIRKCAIVVGYQKQNLIDFVGPRRGAMEISYIHNDVYAKTNNIYSLWLAKDWLLADDTLLLESDLIFEPSVIADLLASPEPTLAVVDKYQSWMDGTVVKVTDDGVISQFVPKRFFDFDEKDSYYKTVNIYKFSRDFLTQTYVPFLEAYTKAMGNNEYYEQVLRVIATLERKDLKALCLTGHKWYEIDDAQDKDIAECMFEDDPDAKLRRMHSRFGGFWRFPGMLDFCYLVNPYFPTRAMLDEMKSSFDELIADYPSGLSVQNLLAGKLFGVEETQIVVGNGAAELIRALSGVLKGSVGVVYPTFNEYPESLSDNEIVPFIAPPGGYALSDLLGWAEKCDNLLLINPDNPSGHFTPRKDVVALLDWMSTRGKRLVLDESFMDFCTEAPGCSLLDQSTIDAYPGLILIKSVSKSYGVPGARLGVLVSSDSATIKAIRKGVSIWNINSFGEFFLQIIGKYRKEYADSCARIIAERESFLGRLAAIPYLEARPSQANYCMCLLTGSFSAHELSKRLLAEHNILIKDLTGKKGIDGDRWIRVAVRDRASNDRLIAVLSGIKP